MPLPESNLTERRYIGEPCEKCDTRTRYKSNYACVNCVAVASAEWKIRNKEKMRSWPSNNSERAKASRKAWADANQDYFPGYYLRNSEKIRGDSKKNYGARREHYTMVNRLWRERNSARCADNRARRDRAIIQQMPAWADVEKMNAVYEKAKKLGLTVDHIAPLQGRTVSGLHVHFNLQLLTRAENARKGNRFESEWEYRAGD